MGCSAKWKREVVPDHKFDFINVQEYRTNAFGTRAKYVWLWITVLIDVGVHTANIYTAITYLLAKGWVNTIQSKCAERDSCAVKVSFLLCKWVFVGCIIFSFLLLFYESWKCRRVLRSRDISYGFTNLYAHKWYSMRSYAHFCFFGEISASTKRADDLAFFIFFTMKSWKEVLIADAPRQVVNGLILYSFGTVFHWQTDDLREYYGGNVVTLMLLLAMIYTVVVFAFSFVLLVAAAVLYLPLLCHIKGNLKEYCCHKVDKRVAELMIRRRNQRVARNAAFEKRLAAQGGKDSKGVVHQQPTLPQIALDDLDDDGQALRPRAAPIAGAARGFGEGPYGPYMPSPPSGAGMVASGAPGLPPGMSPAYGGGGQPSTYPSRLVERYEAFPRSNTGLSSNTFASSSELAIDDPYEGVYGGVGGDSQRLAYDHPPASSSSSAAYMYPSRQQAVYQLPPSGSTATLFGSTTALLPTVGSQQFSSSGSLSAWDHQPPPRSSSSTSLKAGPYDRPTGGWVAAPPLSTTPVDAHGYVVEKASYRPA